MKNFTKYKSIKTKAGTSGQLKDYSKNFYFLCTKYL